MKIVVEDFLTLGDNDGTLFHAILSLVLRSGFSLHDIRSASAYDTPADVILYHAHGCVREEWRFEERVGKDQGLAAFSPVAVIRHSFSQGSLLVT